MQIGQLERREFISFLGGAAAWPLAAHGQQAGKVIRIGFLGASLDSQAVAAQYGIFLAELREHGFNEGKISSSTTDATTIPVGYSPSPPS